MTDGRHEEPVFYDSFFRQRRKHGDYRVIDSPSMESFVADTHTHLQHLPAPGLALARCGVHNVDFICTVVDVFEDGATTFNDLKAWEFEAALGAHRLTSRC